MKRRFTKYPSNYVKASAGIYTDSQLEQMWLDLTDVPFDETEDGRLVLAEDWEQFPAGTDREDIWYFFDDNYSKGVAYLLNDFGSDVEASSCINASSYEGRPHWHAIAEFSDGTTLEFDKLYNANGNYALEEEEQYAIESNLLSRAADTDKEVTFYSVNFVEE
jgi:hypothetical protein